MTQTALDRIKSYKLDEIQADKRTTPLAEVEAAAKAASPTRGFASALMKASKTGYGLIAEVKKASPSKGLIRADFEPASLAKAYESGGATCLSVLTDTPSFQGAKPFLNAARSATSLPALRKDFMYDTYQVAEARALGADCILIIMASVTDLQAQELEDAAFSWGMDVLIESHDAPELERALKLKSPLIGVNNRNLKTFETTLDTTRQLAKIVPDDRILISESGLSTPEDLAAMTEHGARCFLIGESLMRQENVEIATRELLANPMAGAA
ncbi:MAG: indole-3-glycerol phosphate synthase TrpC [Paracoccaceae bacterium]|nr:indole-3-glycerol phosphate synthase TrpC [Paracoccaceae bacterium]MDG1738299.1 indole-3-glycerol phosphate synthase TrpC [Paracoccaceae bacterium]MDG2259342.1 indole-3-glycerol phosphate synthase TrpC [Paracoccaceae bacterium]